MMSNFYNYTFTVLLKSIATKNCLCEIKISHCKILCIYSLSTYF